MVYYSVAMETIVHSLIVKGLLCVLWIASLCEAYQKSVEIDNPCTVGHQYLLGHDDILYVGAEGNQFFTGSCAISLRAYDKSRKCSKICFSVDSFNLDTCDLRLSFYNSGVWNFGSAKPDFKGDCKNSARGDWCTNGETATVRLENKKGNWARMVGKYEFQMVAIARCSEEKNEDPESDWIDGGEKFGLNRTVIVAVVLGCVILCLLVVVAVMCIMYRRHRRPYHAAALSNHHALHSPAEGSYQDHPVQESCGIPVMDFQDNDSLKYVKDVEAPAQQAPEPSAPPIDDCFMDLRPPSYCGAPPGYNGKANDLSSKANDESLTVKVVDGEEEEEDEEDDQEEEEDHMI